MSENESDFESEHELMESFHIDDGQLDGLRLVDAFVLGVEWQMVVHQCKSGQPFERFIHAANVHRIGEVLKARDRVYRNTPSEDPLWAMLKVESQTSEY